MDNYQKILESGQASALNEESEKRTQENVEEENIEEQLKNPNLTKKHKENLKKKLKKKQKKEKTKDGEQEEEEEVKEDEGEGEASKNEKSDENSSLPDFKAELEWCIKQIRLGLSSNVVSKDQYNESMEVLSVLESEKASLVRKRHLMKVVFGDYRKLMKIMK